MTLEKPTASFSSSCSEYAYEAQSNYCICKLFKFKHKLKFTSVQYIFHNTEREVTHLLIQRPNLTHLLSLQFLLFPLLPLFFIYFADLDVSLLLRAYNVCVIILCYSPQNKFKKLNKMLSNPLCFNGFYMKSLRKPV